MSKTPVMNELLPFIDIMARRAGDIANRLLSEMDHLGIEAKGPMDFVTVAEKAVERAVTKIIMERDPAAAVLGEEGSASGSLTGSDYLWIIDPIYGTANYMRKLPWWSVSIALLEKGRPLAGIIHAPAMGVTIATVNGEVMFLNGQSVASPPIVLSGTPLVMSGASPVNIRNGKAEILSTITRSELSSMERRLGCGTASLLQLLLGKADLYIGPGKCIWDVCAAAIIAENFGLRHSIDWDLPPSAQPIDFVCGYPPLFEKTFSKLALL